MSGQMVIVALDVADLGEHLHLVNSGRSLCGRRIDPRDVFELEAGGRVWEESADRRCAVCLRCRPSQEAPA